MATTWFDFPEILVLALLVVGGISLLVRYLPPPSIEHGLREQIRELSIKIDAQEEKLGIQEGIIERLTEQYRSALEEMAEVNRISRIQARTIADLQAKIAELNKMFGVSNPEARLHILGVWPFPDIELNTTVEEYALYNSGFAYRTLRGEDASKEGITLELRRHPYTLLEIGSHGDDDGIRLYDDIARPGWWVRLFNDYPSLQIMLLLACQSDNVGDALVEAGAPIVISIQREIEDRHVAIFIRNFYIYLSGNFHSLVDVEKAVTFASNLIPEKSATLIRVRTNFTEVR